MGIFKDRLNQALKSSGMTASELARQSGLDKGAISRYLKGEFVPKQDNVEALAKALHVRTTWLLCIDDEPEFKLPDSIKNSPDLKKPLVIECYYQLNEDGQLELEHYFKYLLSKQKDEPDSSEAGK